MCGIFEDRDSKPAAAHSVPQAGRIGKYLARIYDTAVFLRGTAGRGRGGPGYGKGFCAGFGDRSITMLENALRRAKTGARSNMEALKRLAAIGPYLSKSSQL